MIEMAEIITDLELHTEGSRGITGITFEVSEDPDRTLPPEHPMPLR